MSYAADKLRDACAILKSNVGTPKTRLANAIRQIHLLSGGHGSWINSELKLRLQAILNRVSVVRDPQRGTIDASVQHLWDDEVDQLSIAIESLCNDVCEEEQRLKDRE